MEVDPDRVEKVELAEVFVDNEQNEREQSRSALVQVQLEGEGRHREAECCNCATLHQTSAAEFNFTLQIAFVLLFGFALISIMVTEAHFSRGFSYVTRWRFCSIGLVCAGFVGVFGLCVDVRRADYTLRPDVKHMIMASALKVREWKHRTSTETLPQCSKVLSAHVSSALAWLNNCWETMEKNIYFYIC